MRGGRGRAGGMGGCFASPLPTPARLRAQGQPHVCDQRASQTRVHSRALVGWRSVGSPRGGQRHARVRQHAESIYLGSSQPSSLIKPQKQPDKPQPSVTPRPPPSPCVQDPASGRG